MDQQALRTYLDEHLVGASTVTRLVERRLDDGVGPDWLREFRADLQQERQVVEQVAERLGSSGAVPTHLIGGAAQLAVRGALRLTEQLHPSLRDLIEFETMLVGVHGKAALWRTLSLWPEHPAVAGIDLEGLEQRADDQAERLEDLRTAAARALGSTAPA